MATTTTTLLSDDESRDERLVSKYVAARANATFREPSGFLTYPYLVPAGVYNQLWDWDSLFMGVALLHHGSAPYLAGAMKNFLAQTNLTDGSIGGCLTPKGPAKTEYHAKPVIVQGAYLAARAQGNLAQFRPFEPAMRALLSYWDTQRTHAPTGLPLWHDQLESGCDNLVISTCPSSLSPECWNPKYHQLKISAPGLVTFLHREHTALAAFATAWAVQAAAEASASRAAANGLEDASTSEEEVIRLRNLASFHTARAHTLHKALDTYLWAPDLGHYTAWNISGVGSVGSGIGSGSGVGSVGSSNSASGSGCGNRSSVDSITPSSSSRLGGGSNSSRQSVGARVPNRVFLMGVPLWAGLANATQANSVAAALASTDMLSDWGVRSVSSRDPRYNNDNIIVPYSNWRGPVWVNANAMLALGLARYNHTLSLAHTLARRVVAALASDIRASGTWHECYSAQNGSGLAAPGFLSWDTLGAVLLSALRNGTDPFRI